jgi:hypothetical protein
MRSVRLLLLGVLFALSSVAANGQAAAPEWIAALRQGGHVIVFRHGATFPDQADTDPLNPKNVAQQRQLNDDGRALAKAIGEAMRKLKIPVGEVQTSLFQRAVDTGTLLGFGDGPRPTSPKAASSVSPNENNRRAQALRASSPARPGRQQQRG